MKKLYSTFPSPKNPNKHLVLKVFLSFSLICFSLNAFAFGGGGKGRTATRYQQGVSAYGAHFGGHGQVDIRLTCNEETESVVGIECCLNNLIYIEDDEEKCCNKEDYEIVGATCQKNVK